MDALGGEEVVGGGGGGEEEGRGGAGESVRVCRFVSVGVCECVVVWCLSLSRSSRRTTSGCSCPEASVGKIIRNAVTPQPWASVSASVPAEGTRGNWMCVGVLKRTWRISPKEAFEKKTPSKRTSSPGCPRHGCCGPLKFARCNCYLCTRTSDGLPCARPRGSVWAAQRQFSHLDCALSVFQQWD